MVDYPAHPAADAFPLMVGEEFDALCADIRENGLREPITLFNGAILDGRNRLRACEAIGLTPIFIDWPNGGDPHAYVISANLHRRHLSVSQKKTVLETLVEQKPELSNRAIGKLLKISKTTATKWRNELKNNNNEKDGQNDRPQKNHSGRIAVPEGETAETMIRKSIEMDESGLGYTEIAAEIGMGRQTITYGQRMIFLKDGDLLNDHDAAIVGDAIKEMNESRRVIAAWEKVKPIADKVFGNDKRGTDQSWLDVAEKRQRTFQRGLNIFAEAARNLPRIEVPYLSSSDLSNAIDLMKAAKSAIRSFERSLSGD